VLGPPGCFNSHCCPQASGPLYGDGGCGRPASRTWEVFGGGVVPPPNTWSGCGGGGMCSAGASWAAALASLWEITKEWVFKPSSFDGKQKIWRLLNAVCKQE